MQEHIKPTVMELAMVIGGMLLVLLVVGCMFGFATVAMVRHIRERRQDVMRRAAEFEADYQRIVNSINSGARPTRRRSIYSDHS
ncbi:hypothetical protein EVB87_244 [Rhizobium phage RHph_N28_1]|nr:hypothetical protein EVB87_244 [Rhizobium phage RHph_N28_1]QIG74273.1 hypothetical protein EVC07_245 [Rhizobium phage RHph_N42]QXV73933.1 hypothetical protein [Rhizobium phage RHph_N46]